MRKLHRWISTTGMILFLYMTATGTTLSIVEYKAGPAIFDPSLAVEGESSARTDPSKVSLPSTESSPSINGGTRNASEDTHIGAFVAALHGGAVAGKFGQWLVLIAGIAATVLSVSGITIYLQMWQVRKRRGHRAWFWG